MHVADDADDRDRVARVDGDRMADRILAAPELARHRLADDGHRRRRRRVRVREVAPAQKRDAQGVEVAGAGRPIVGVRRRRGRPAVDVEPSRAVAGRQRQPAGGADRLDAGNRADGGHGAIEERDLLRRRGVSRGRQAERQRHEMIGVEAGRHALQLDQAPDRQSRADEEHEREGDLRRDERRARALLAGAARTARRSLQVVVDVRVQGLARGRETEEQPRAGGHREAEQQDGRVHAHVAGHAEIARAERDERPDQPHREAACRRRRRRARAARSRPAAARRCAAGSRRARSGPRFPAAAPSRAPAADRTRSRPRSAAAARRRRTAAGASGGRRRRGRRAAA